MMVGKDKTRFASRVGGRTVHTCAQKRASAGLGQIRPDSILMENFWINVEKIVYSKMQVCRVN